MKKRMQEEKPNAGGKNEFRRKKRIQDEKTNSG